MSREQHQSIGQIRDRLASGSRQVHDRLETTSRQNPNKFMTNRGPLIKLVTNLLHEEAQ